MLPGFTPNSFCTQGQMAAATGNGRMKVSPLLSSAGSYVTSTICNLFVMAQGGGGGGGRSGGYVGGGGGSAGSCRGRWFYAIPAGTAVSYLCGLGGTGATASATGGTAGSPTTVQLPLRGALSAFGGLASAAQSGTAGAGTNDNGTVAGGFGGNPAQSGGAAGDVNLGLGVPAGGAPGATVAQGQGGGGGGDSYFGKGGQGGVGSGSAPTVGLAGSGYGGGGGGGGGNNLGPSANGGDGLPGCVQFIEVAL